MGLFRAIVVILFAGLFFYSAHQLTRFAELPVFINLAVVLFLAIIFGMVLSLPLYFWTTDRHSPKAWYETYFALTYLAIGYINYLILFIILRDIIAFLSIYLLPDFNSASLYDARAMGIILLLPTVFILLGILVVKAGPQLKKVILKFPDLPGALQGLRIFHITDLHISHNMPNTFLEKVVQLCQADPADIVVLTGDLIDDLPSRYKSDITYLQKIPSKYGKYFVPGNHEYYWQAEPIFAEFQRHGFHVLINQCHSLTLGASELQICGVPDPAARMFGLETPDFKKVEEHLQQKSFKILLSHQPSLADFAAPVGFDLQLSGHTHGGQFLPWNFLIGFFQKYGKGLYKINNMQLYVNQGTGYWGPKMRLGTYCEVTEIHLTQS